MNRVAIIDIGSNSLKLIISDIYDNKFFQISYEKKTKLRLSNYKTRAVSYTHLNPTPQAVWILPVSFVNK